MKCAASKAAITNKEAPTASKTVITITLLPKALMVLILNDVPIEKAIKPKATVDTHPRFLTKPKMRPSLIFS